MKMEISVDKVIRENLGEKTLEKIESRLLERYNLTVNQGIFEFEKFDSVLKEFFGDDGATGLERRIQKAFASK